MMRVLAAVLIALAAPAAGQGVGAAIASGAVGERYDGYLGVWGQIAPGVRREVANINIQRRTLYSNLATQRRVSPSDVGITAGCSLLARVRPGQSYLLADGQWRRRGPGEAPPVPDYCR